MYTQALSFNWCIDFEDKTKNIIFCVHCNDIECSKSKFRKQTEDLIDLKQEYINK